MGIWKSNLNIPVFFWKSFPSMHFLVVSCVFPPEPVVSGQTSVHIAEELLQRKHSVTVITSFPNRPEGKLYPGYKQGLFKHYEEPNGLKVIRCFSILSPRSSLISRFLENISFGITSGISILTAKRPAVIYGNTWPIFATGILWLVARIRGIPLIISIQDVYPESLIIQKRIDAKGWRARALRWIDKKISQSCYAIVVISENFKNIYLEDRKILEQNLHLIPNWLSEKAISLKEKNNPIRKIHHIPEGAFLVVYGGNIGIAAGVETVLESFRELGEIQNLYLLIAGAGNNLEACQDLAQEIGSGRIIFHTPWLNEETSDVLSAADLLVLPTQGEQSLVSVPSKLIAYMLSARPVIALGLPGSEIARLINCSGCGWVIEPGRPSKLADKIKEVMTLDEKSLLLHGLAGRQYALKNLTSDVNLPRVITLLEKAASTCH